MSSDVEKVLENMLGDDNVLGLPQSRVEEILQDILNEVEYTEKPRSRVEALLIALQQQGGEDITVEPLSVTENGTYTAESGFAYNPVTVDVPSSGGSSVGDVIFYDYDGAVVESYSAEDFAALTAMPENPSHSGLTAQGWNWSLSNAQSYVAKYGKLNIGQMYITDDGKTRFYIHFDADVPANRRAISIGLQSSVADNVTVDWGDGTTETVGSTTAVEARHQYASAGDYVATLTVNSGNIQLKPLSTSMGPSMQIGLNKVECGRDLTFIGDYIFKGCRNLSSVTIPDSVTRIGSYAFNNCYSLSSVTIPNGVTIIYNYTFNNCYSLSSITIPNSVTSIYNYIFRSCHSLSSVTIPDGVTSIPDNTFVNCYSLSFVTIPDSVTSIGSYAFNNCYHLSSVIIPDGVTSIDSYAFTNCHSLSSVIIPDGVTNIAISIFNSCSTLSSVTIPDSVTSIAGSAFNNCYSLSSITIPDGVTSISSSAFRSCYSLSSVIIPDSVTRIGGSAFSDCYSLSSITIPNSVTSIDGSAFANCYSLSSVTIPNGVTSIGASAFSKCTEVSEYHLLPTTPPTLSNSNAFMDIVSDCVIYVPAGTLEAYQTATNWATYASHMQEES